MLVDLFHISRFSPPQQSYSVDQTLSNDKPVPLLMEVDRHQSQTVLVTVTLSGASSQLTWSGLDLFYDDSGKEEWNEYLDTLNKEGP